MQLPKPWPLWLGARTPPSASLTEGRLGHGNLLTSQAARGSQLKGEDGCVYQARLRLHTARHREPRDALGGDRGSWTRVRGRVRGQERDRSWHRVLELSSSIFCPRRTHVDAWQMLATCAQFVVFISFMNVHTQWWQWAFTFLF